MLFEILEDLNSYFESGEINEIITTEIISIDDVIDIILENTSPTAGFIKSKTRTNSVLEAKINQWWITSANEYGFDPTKSANKLSTLSMVILTDWVFKIIFANILKKHFNQAKEIESINYETSVNDAIATIEGISENCNFWNIFSSNLAQELISDDAWYQLTELNQYLSNINPLCRVKIITS